MTASGKTYGPWYGGGTESFNTQGMFKETCYIGLALTGGVSMLLEEAVAEVIVGAILTYAGLKIDLLPDDYTYGTVSKKYREVYVNGEFSCFQTQMITKAYYVRNGVSHYLGTDTRICEGSYPMLVKN